MTDAEAIARLLLELRRYFPAAREESCYIWEEDDEEGREIPAVLLATPSGDVYWYRDRYWKGELGGRVEMLGWAYFINYGMAPGICGETGDLAGAVPGAGGELCEDPELVALEIRETMTAWLATAA